MEDGELRIIISPLFPNFLYLCRLISNDPGKYGKTEENITRHPQGNSLFRIRDSIYLVINQRFKQRRCPDDLLFDVAGQQPARVVFHHAFGRGNCSGGPCACRQSETPPQVHSLQTPLVDDVLLRDGLLLGQPRPAPSRRSPPLHLPATLRKRSLPEIPWHGYPRTRR